MSAAESIRCPFCGMVSYNPKDVQNRYCGNCHRFHADSMGHRFVALGFERRSFELYLNWCETSGRDPEVGLQRFARLKSRAPELFDLAVTALAEAWKKLDAQRN